MANIVRYIPLFHTLYVHMHAWKYPNHVQTILKKWFAHSHFVRIEIILLYSIQHCQKHRVGTSGKTYIIYVAIRSITHRDSHMPELPGATQTCDDEL